jgi:hypothetical protein
MQFACDPISGVSMPETNGTPSPNKRISCPSQRTVLPSTAVGDAHTKMVAIVWRPYRDSAPSTTTAAPRILTGRTPFFLLIASFMFAPMLEMSWLARTFVRHVPPMRGVNIEMAFTAVPYDAVTR